MSQYKLVSAERPCYNCHMPKITKDLLVGYTPGQMYELINAVELYPEFLPWCHATEVHERSDDELSATLHLVKGPVKHQIKTNNKMIPGSKISMQYVAGPFKTCHGSWDFLAEGSDCRVMFNMEYQFSNKIQQMLIEPVFHPIANALIDAFQERADQVYGR